MRIIAEGNRDCRRLLSRQIMPAEGLLVKSPYVLRQEVPEGTLLCSTLTGLLAWLSPAEALLYDRLPAPPEPAYQELLSCRFAVPASVREEQTAAQLRALLLRRLAAKKVITAYNILPTTCCNARCFYCYESGIRHVQMTEDTAAELVAFIAAHHGGEAVSLSWFGGEPTLGCDRIDQICEGLAARGIGFRSGMTSNGYLFDPALVRRAVERWRLKFIQITLDGTAEVYRRTKAYPGITDDPYERVLRNIGLLAGAGVRVDIRLNLDSHNAVDLRELVRELSERYRDRRCLRIYVSQLDEGAGFAPISHTSDDLVRLSRQLTVLRDELQALGWPQFARRRLPSLRVCSCMADNPCAVQCTPEGILSKCEDQIYQHTVGSLAEGVTGRENERWWQERRDFAGCAACPLYPGCVRLLKNCPVKQTRCSEHELAHSLSACHSLMLEHWRAWQQNPACQEGADEFSDLYCGSDC